MVSRSFRIKSWTRTDQLVGYSAMINALARLIDQHPEQFTIQGDEGFIKLFTQP
jgi:hypothetical protein